MPNFSFDIWQTSLNFLPNSMRRILFLEYTAPQVGNVRPDDVPQFRICANYGEKRLRPGSDKIPDGHVHGTVFFGGRDLQRSIKFKSSSATATSSNIAAAGIMRHGSNSSCYVAKVKDSSGTCHIPDCITLLDAKPRTIAPDAAQE